MSHEIVEPGRAVVYNLPSAFSDTLRTLQFDQFFSQYAGSAFAVRTLDGWSWSSSTLRTPEFVATFRTRDSLDAVIGDAKETTLSRIFLDGGLEIQGNIFILLSAAEYTLRHSEGLSNNLIQTVGRISLDVSRRLIPGRKGPTSHNWHCTPCPLDLPVEFFEPWLGSCLGHFCAHFRDCDEDFDTAQRNAFERACGMLELEGRDRLLDVGCGWGSLLLYAAEHFGADSRGIASSGLQVQAAEERICRRGLAWKCSVETRDLRTSPFGAEAFDKITHLGVFEQVPFSALGKYLACMQKMLVPGGLLLLDRMTRARDCGAIARSIQPGLPSEPLSKELDMAESAGFELISAESLRDEYEQTLRVWIEHLLCTWMRQGSRPFARGYRAWLLYLVEIAASLSAEELQVHRILLRRPRAARAA
ncbi:MAG TPA: class I SAM-dependent methyltransferase [Terracidiphilus sp.]